MENNYNMKNRIIELFEQYSVDYSDLQKSALKVGADPNQLPSFVPWARVDGQNISMVGKQYKSETLYGYSSEEEAREKINKSKTLPGWKSAESFWIEVMFGDKVVDILEV